MELIFHEKQEGSLCAQHCLNALLQNNLFSAPDLGEIARRLDERERETMAEGGINTYDYQRFLEQPSNNYDDSGYFSIQVITEALEVWGLTLMPFTSSDAIARQAREDPTQQNAYICHFRQHWFTIRKLGHQWFNLNSLLTGPELISDTYLSLMLTQLEQEGYSIFIVLGNLPQCEADDLLKQMRVVQTEKPSLIAEAQSLMSVEGDMDEDMRQALEESRQFSDREDHMLQRALQDSMIDAAPQFSEPSTSEATPTQEELRQRRQAFLHRLETQSRAPESDPKPENSSGEMTEDDMLSLAIAMSMDQPNTT